MGTVVDLVSYSCAWLVLGSGALFTLVRVLSNLAERRARTEPPDLAVRPDPAARPDRLRALEAQQEQHVVVRRAVVLSTALIPTITVR